ncbi:MAG: hypothetical protein EHM28_05150 [Spirochaetaceae bacterium]|nr:MAG: hypothetical protein EHM28_05150 [Spirochaetaceae bacterium]
MKSRLLMLVLGACLLFSGFGANITIPSIELATYILGIDHEMIMITDSSMDFLIDGGYKFGAKITLGVDGFIALPGDTATGPEKGTINLPLSLKYTEIIVRDLFGVPLDLSYFIGEGSNLCYGDEFSRLFGTPVIQSAFTPPLYISDPLLFYQNPILNYRGIHRINGNGIKLQYHPLEGGFGFEWYLYQDHNFRESYEIETATGIMNLNMIFLDTGWYASDMRFFLNTEIFKMEVFIGGSIDSGSFQGCWRGGALFFFGLGPVDIMAEVGLPTLDFGNIGGLEMFYILYEMRIHAGPITITPTIFSHPATYLQQPNMDNTERIDFAMDLSVFDPRKDFISFGFEGAMTTFFLFSMDDPPWVLFLSPHITFATPGVSWEIKLRTTLWDSTMTSFDPQTFITSMQGVMSIRAEL